MNKSSISVDGKQLPLYKTRALVIGSGAASLNGAVHLKQLGTDDLLLVTRNIGDGTSANAGSDKQTYYKLSVSNGNSDSPREMANSYYRNGATHGDLALIESALSVREFFHLVELGVDFPHNRYGEYVGYKTDHDPRGRGTSAGPWTSQQMVEKLGKKVIELGIEVIEDVEIISLLTDEDEEGDKQVIGALGIERGSSREEERGFVVFQAENIIFGVGGPGGLYADSVYPKGHVGSIGLALEQEAIASNLTEGQYGLASTDFRWNLSGSYQQVIPRYYSIGEDGREIDFLNQVFPTTQKMAEAIFLKGYQWPFDPGKVKNFGSSLIDLLVYRETRIKKRSVYMDFRTNPRGINDEDEFSIDRLTGEPKEYLARSRALDETPIERLKSLNSQAIELYREHGIDLEKEPLKIAVCAQHNNGGLYGNIWWESNLKGLFPVGEVNGSHGVSRPGGTALNGGQVGGLRAAQFITRSSGKNVTSSDLIDLAGPQIREKLELAESFIERNGDESKLSPREVIDKIQDRMSLYGAHIRPADALASAAAEAAELRESLPDNLALDRAEDLPKAFQSITLAITSSVYLKALAWYIEQEGGSRGSYLIKDPKGEERLGVFGEEWRYREENQELREKVQETYLDENGKVVNRWVPRREIPEGEQWFENVWKNYNSGDYFKRDGA